MNWLPRAKKQKKVLRMLLRLCPILILVFTVTQVADAVERVLSPWSPLEHVAPGKISCWNRVYDVSRGPLPGIKSGGKQLFSTRPTVLVKVDGRETALFAANELVTLGLTSSKQRGTAELPGGGFAAWDTELHYDGWFQVDFSLNPQQRPMQIEGLRIVLPVKSEHASQLCAPEWKGWNGKNWSTSIGSESYLARRQQPCIWLGDTDRGVAWMGGSDANWVLTKRPNARVKRLGETVFLEVKLIQRPVEVTRRLTYTFSVQATPVRPPTPHAREFCFSVEGERNTVGWEGSWFKTGTPLRVYPQERRSRDWTLWRKWYPRGLFPYFALYRVGSESEIVQTETQRWEDGKPIEEPPHDESRVCIGSKPWRDWLLKWAAESLKYEEVGGIYLDVCHLARCNSPLHGHQHQDQFGRDITARWNVQEQREIHKQLYELCESHKKKLVVHALTAWWPSVHGWAHHLLAGEDTYSKVNLDRNTNTSDNPWAYTSTVPLGYWKTLHRLGPGTLFLPQFGRASPKSDLKNLQPSRSVLGMIGVHGCGLYNMYVNRNQGTKFYRELLELYADADFHPYWESNEYAQRPLLVSFYERPSGQRMVIYVNPTDQPVGVGGRTVAPRDFLLVNKRGR